MKGVDLDIVRFDEGEEFRGKKERIFEVWFTLENAMY